LRRELEIRITVPEDDDKKYLSDIYMKALNGYVGYCVEHGHDIPKTGRQVFDEAVVWWCSRVVP